MLKLNPENCGIGKTGSKSSNWAVGSVLPQVDSISS